MSVDEATRHRLHTRLEQVLGTEEAAALMEHLPPVGWADVATKRDLDGAVDLLRSEVMRSLHSEISALQRHLVVVLLGANATMGLTIAGLAFAAAKLV